MAEDELDENLREAIEQRLRTVRVPSVSLEASLQENSSLKPKSQHQDDVLIVVMGPCGTGKSTFINLVLGKNEAAVGHTLRCGTKDVQNYSFSYIGIDFTLVDTPGFDDTAVTETQILRKISDWLAKSYRAGCKLTSIIYFHRITDPRMQGAPLRNLQMFKSLCGEAFYGNVVLGTTFWGISDETLPGVAETREKQLAESDMFWSPMVSKGSELVRIPENRWLARELVVRLAKKRKMTLAAQHELVDKGTALEQTTASQVLQTERQKLIAEQEAEVEKIKEDFKKKQEAQKAAAKKEEEARQREHAAEMEKQKEEYEQLEKERKNQEAERNRLREKAEQDRKRLEQEQAELAATLKRLKLEKVIKSRGERALAFREEVQASFTLLAAKQATGDVLCRFYPLDATYNLMCDNCFSHIGVGTFYRCTICNDGQFDLCLNCYWEPDVFCNDSSHFESMQHQQYDSRGNCRRIVNPPKPGDALWCSRCLQTIRTIYFHCCLCDADDFDMCLNCVINSKTCKKGWSVRGHILNICTQYPTTV